MDILRAKSEQLLALEDETKDGSLTQNLEEISKAIIRELEGKKLERGVVAKCISSEKLQHEEIKQKIIRESCGKERDQLLLGFLSSGKQEHEELIRPNTNKYESGVQLEWPQQHLLHQKKKKQFKNLHNQLRHKRSHNVGEERAILKELSQLDEMVAKGKGKGKEKDGDEEDMTTGETLNFYDCSSMEEIIEDIEWSIDSSKESLKRLRQEELSKRYSISKLEEEMFVIERRIQFLERRLASLSSNQQRSSK